MSRGCSRASRAIARRIFSSDSTLSPYPLLISHVVVPHASISSSRTRVSATSASSVAARVAATVATMPPPAAAISA